METILIERDSASLISRMRMYVPLEMDKTTFIATNPRRGNLSNASIVAWSRPRDNTKTSSSMHTKYL
jgi:hypothetical protein